MDDNQTFRHNVKWGVIGSLVALLILFGSATACSVTGTLSTQYRFIPVGQCDYVKQESGRYIYECWRDAMIRQP